MPKFESVVRGNLPIAISEVLMVCDFFSIRSEWRIKELHKWPKRLVSAVTADSWRHVVYVN